MAKCPYCGNEMERGYIGCDPGPAGLPTPQWYEEIEGKWGPRGEELGTRALKLLYGRWYYTAERCVSCSAIVFKYPNVAGP